MMNDLESKLPQIKIKREDYPELFKSAGNAFARTVGDMLFIGFKIMPSEYAHLEPQSTPTEVGKVVGYVAAVGAVTIGAYLANNIWGSK